MNQRPLVLQLEKAISGFLQHKTAEGLSPNSIKSYEIYLNLWFSHSDDLLCGGNGYHIPFHNVIDFHLTPLVSNQFYNRVNGAGCDTLELKSLGVSVDRESPPREDEIPLPSSG